MILSNFNDFPRQGRIFAIDWGARRIGMAVSDDTRNFVFIRPILHIDKSNKSVPILIADIIKKENVVGVVIGLPIRLDGTESDTTAKVREFARNLSCYVDVPIIFIDETLTSLTAQEDMGKKDVSDIKNSLDSESARVILENAISVIKRLQ